uniref:Uncharacterized protein n=1 Tax=Nelumbo nucifera TaxID=4432 RepID=A0A822XL53_NELNU|nr:TPA_asm: hypothetical protein HUJ06_021262 [Nelumbo nucifera]
MGSVSKAALLVHYSFHFQILRPTGFVYKEDLFLSSPGTLISIAPWESGLGRVSQTLLARHKAFNLEGDEWLNKEDGVVDQSLRSDVPPSQRSDCTNLPSNGGGHCPPVNSKNYAIAGHHHIHTAA